MKKLDPSEFWFEDILKSNAATHLCLDWELNREKMKRDKAYAEHSNEYEFLMTPYMDRRQKNVEYYYDCVNGGDRYRDDFPDENHVDVQWQL